MDSIGDCGTGAGCGFLSVTDSDVMKYLSVCSGIEAATVAWKPLGWNAVGFAEIEKLPSRVLDYHYPDVPNHGDMNDFQSWPKSDVDVLVGGTPCQSFSVAGLRQGMVDPRGNLALVYLAIAEHYRPEWLVWENVPGVLSSNGGRDFGSIIGGMVELGYGIAYRVLDAQYFGVPQRRRRVFVVGHSGDWRRAAQVLFESESLRRDSPPSREKRQGIANGIAKSIRGCSGGIDREDMHTLIPSHDPAMTLTAREYKGPLPEADLSTVITHTLRGEGFDASENGTGRGTPLITAPLTAGSLCPGVNAAGRRRADDENIVVHNTVAIRMAQTGSNGKGIDEDVAYTLDGTQGQAVAFAQNQRDEVRLMDKAGALSSQPGAKQQTYVKQDMAVRRLTPLECERLQGFPDNYTNIPGASDSGRYKALGNSMAVPVMNWIGSRINGLC